MDTMNAIVFHFLPTSLTHNIYFGFAVALLYALLSCAMSFVKDPRFGWLAKYNDPIELALKELGWLKDKEASVNKQGGFIRMGVAIVLALFLAFAGLVFTLQARAMERNYLLPNEALKAPSNCAQGCHKRANETMMIKDKTVRDLLSCAGDCHGCAKWIGADTYHTPSNCAIQCHACMREDKK
jgi:hypothetical protein